MDRVHMHLRSLRCYMIQQGRVWVRCRRMCNSCLQDMPWELLAPAENSTFLLGRAHKHLRS